jgi:hypothetical protein
MLLAAARHDPKIRAWVIKGAGKAVTREIDKKRLQPLLDELKAMKDEKAGDEPKADAREEQAAASLSALWTVSGWSAS